MLITQEELRFDFRGATFDLSSEEDRKLLGWVFNQFLYGEVTGIQCGHWLYHAPHLSAAAFLAKQASEEISHVRKILRILTLLGQSPAPPHPVIRFLSTGMMGHSWGEHVTLEMALGEGLVLAVFYAMTDTIPDPEIQRILVSASVEEERHVIFGERETQRWLEAHPEDRRFLLGQALIQRVAMRRLKSFLIKRIVRSARPDHPVLSQMDAFYSHVVTTFERRVERLGLSDAPLSQWNGVSQAALILSAWFGGFRRSLMRRLGRKPRLLTQIYLEDEWVKGESIHATRRASEREISSSSPAGPAGAGEAS